ncbi:MAG: ribbon-helix-helix domain-containing protein [Alphaproteobacteria bacterium]|nr:ribbon-helix-helix domain-containing protein [Alphaproteobacteria bacterium]
MKKISITISGHRTSITLENEFLDILRRIAARRGKSIAEIIKEIDAEKLPNANLSSAIRVFILKSIDC